MGASGADDADDPPRCGSTDTVDGSPCRQPVSAPDDTCYLHGPDGEVPDGTGSGHPNHSQGGGPGDIDDKVDQAADKPALKHGLNVVDDDPGGLLAWIEDHDPAGHRWVLDKWRSYMVGAPFGRHDARADDVMEAVLMRYAVRQARRRQVQSGLTKMMTATDDQGREIDLDIEQEDPANLPANRIAREARSMLKDLNVFDADGDGGADSGSWADAAKRVAQRRDDAPDGSDAIDVDHRPVDGPGGDQDGGRG